jgi:lipopolysaccharide/colanic/teichoic acid biosynthesis glycosyltransferase
MALCASLVPHPVPYARVKRVLDVLGAAVLLLLFLPAFVLLSILVKLTSRGPVFYKSTRVGLCGRPFTFVKFRTMRKDADKMLHLLEGQNEKDGPIFKMRHDPRITPVGALLRRFSLDELPQLWSVLVGDMSLVGPRPPIPREVEQYDAFALRRLTVKPGITCFWQVMGRSTLSFQEWMELDCRYIDEMSFWTDLRLLVMTPISVIRSNGAY